MKKIAILGSGAWAIGILKILQDHGGFEIHWWVRLLEEIEHIREHKKTINYLPHFELPLQNVWIHNQVQDAVQHSEIIILATPSAYLPGCLEYIDIKDIENKYIVSAIKGFEPQSGWLISQYFEQAFHLNPKHFIVVSGPSHAEEVIETKQTYLTVACTDKVIAKIFAEIFSTSYIQTRISTDVIGIQLAGLMKNIYAMALGIVAGMDMGDNFRAVMVAAAVREMELFFAQLSPHAERKLTESAYLGDLLVTAYSEFSRNRTLGVHIGQGKSFGEILQTIPTLPEGFFALKIIIPQIQSKGIKLPIVEFVHETLAHPENRKKLLQELLQEL